MAFVYLPYKQSILNADANVNLSTNTTVDGVYCSLQPAAYTALSSHQFASQLATAIGVDTRIVTTGTSAAVANGTFIGGNLTYTAVASGSTVTQLALYRSNSGGVASGYRLVVYFATGDVTGLPVATNGGNITVTWNGAGIFTISDRAMKRDIRQVGKLGPLRVYEFRYAWSRDRICGFVAQDVEAVFPSAVAVIDGVKRVDYPLVMRLAT